MIFDLEIRDALSTSRLAIGELDEVLRHAQRMNLCGEWRKRIKKAAAALDDLDRAVGTIAKTHVDDEPNVAAKFKHLATVGGLAPWHPCDG